MDKIICFLFSQNIFSIFSGWTFHFRFVLTLDVNRVRALISRGTFFALSRNVLCLIAERSLPYRGTFFALSRNVLSFSRNVLCLLAERSLLSISLNIRTKEYNLYGLLHHASRIYTVCCTMLAESIRFVAPC